MPETKCSKCGKLVGATVSFSVPYQKPTPPLCMKCFRAATRATVKTIRENWHAAR